MLQPSGWWVRLMKIINEIFRDQKWHLSRNEVVGGWQIPFEACGAPTPCSLQTMQTAVSPNPDCNYNATMYGVYDLA